MNDWPKGTDRVELAQTDSTMSEALARAGQGAQLPVWVRADTQSAGRARRGRAWVPGDGNFYASLALETGTAARLSALRSFAAALALHDTLVDVGINPDDIALKWPNDVLLRGCKLAGILLESTQVGGRQVLIIGIGVNLATAPSPHALETGAVAPISLIEAGVEVSPARFLDRLAPAFHHWEQTLRREGFAALRAAWLSRAARLGEVITARLPDQEIVGRFTTVDPTGAIVLDTPSGRRTLSAAEIHF